MQKLDTRSMFLTSGATARLVPGTYEIDHTIEIGDGSPQRSSSVASICFEGSGMGANAGEMDMSAGTTLVWTGPPGGTMVRINGPIYGVRLGRMSLNGSGSCGIAVEARHAVNSTFEEIQIRNLGPNGTGFRLMDHMIPKSGMVVGASGNYLRQIRVHGTDNGCVGFDLGAPTANGGCSGNIFTQCSALSTTVGWRFRFTDYIKLVMCQAYQNKYPVEVVPASGNQWFPTAVYFDEWSTDSGEVRVIGKWDPWPNTGFVFSRFHREYAGGNPTLADAFGPRFPAGPQFSGTDNLGNVYPHKLTR